jgi:hypothetical protein
MLKPSKGVAIWVVAAARRYLHVVAKLFCEDQRLHRVKVA